MAAKLTILLVVLLPALAAGLCPFLHGDGSGNGSPQLPRGHPKVSTSSFVSEASDAADFAPPAVKAPAGYEEAVRNLDIQAVKDDLKVLFRDSKDWWPADYGTYAPFFVRLAWHCSGSYRVSDGRGGCDGGRQRFDPERSWADNVNLDKARALLMPLKNKYGKALSWGDAFILAGTTAVEVMGGPTIGFCAGRIDDPNGYWSQELGPTAEQEEFAPCKVNGTCELPLGSTTIGLIYLNPEGPMGQPIPHESALDVRDAFSRMAMNDSETVALIGGGHAFGKTHGACPAGPGPSPKDDPAHPWPGECGTGKGVDAFTSGFEGPWTQDPTAWDNEYFSNLLEFDYEVTMGPGGHHQWMVSNASKSRPTAPSADGKGRQDLMMLTSDVSLMHDPAGGFQKWVETFAKDQQAFDDAFAHAWYKLTTRDMGPASRCVGNLVPPPQPFQYPLPPTPKHLADFTKVADMVRSIITMPQPSILPPDEYSGVGTYGPLFVRLAWQCASTFRVTDFQGGCNGARLRFSPEKDWPVNKGLDKTLELLSGVKNHFGDELSWADLIALAGTVALEEAGSRQMHFCGGRTDADDGVGSQYVKPLFHADMANATSEKIVDSVRDAMKIMGLSSREFVALQGGGHSLGQKHASRTGFSGAWDATPTVLDNAYFKALLEQQWDAVTVKSTGKVQYQTKAKGAESTSMLATDMALAWDAELAGYAQEFAADSDAFLDAFASAWTKMMNADRFDGPIGNICNKRVTDREDIVL